MKLNDASRITRETLDKYGLNHVEVVFNGRLTRAFGRYRYSYAGRKWIELSTQLVLINDEERVTRTILHEVAHALTEGHHHDKVWQAKCREIGGDGKMYYSSSDTNTIERTRAISTKRYTLKCQKCGMQGGVYRRRMNGYRHRGCLGEMVSVEL